MITRHTACSSLREKRLSLRLLFLVGSGAGSLTAALLSEPKIFEIGFCGLSGIAHGLMAVWALELFLSPQSSIFVRQLGAISFTLVSLKCLWESILNAPFWGFAHFKPHGNPHRRLSCGGSREGMLHCAPILPSFSESRF